MEFAAVFLLSSASLAIWCCIHRILQLGKQGIKSWPLLGAALEVSANFHTIYEWILDKLLALNCTTIIVPMFFHSYVITVDPRNVEHILKSNFENYPKGNTFQEKFKPLLGNGIFNSDGEMWRMQRKTASFEFASRVLKDFSAGLFKEYALKLDTIVSEASAAGKAVDIQDLLMRMTLDSICRFGFGVELGVLDPALPENKFAIAFDKCNETISYRFADPFWKIKSFFGCGLEGSLKKHIKVVDTFTHDIIKKRRAQLLQDKKQEHIVAQRYDTLSRFMSMDHLNISDKNLRDIILNFVIAGRDTTASTLSWFIYRVASDSRVSLNIHKELLEFDKAHNVSASTSPQSMLEFSRLLSYEALSKLHYLHAAIMETLRLHPAVPLNFKGVERDEVLPDGSSVKRGDLVCYAPWCMGRMSFLWGSDAEKFIPERWLKNGEWDFNVSPFKFTAFQAGPRICLGRENAYLQMKITTAILCRFFSFEIVPGQTTTYRVMATMPILNGLKVVVKTNC